MTVAINLENDSVASLERQWVEATAAVARAGINPRGERIYNSAKRVPGCDSGRRSGTSARCLPPWKSWKSSTRSRTSPGRDRSAACPAVAPAVANTPGGAEPRLERPVTVSR